MEILIVFIGCFVANIVYDLLKSLRNNNTQASSSAEPRKKVVDERMFSDILAGYKEYEDSASNLYNPRNQSRRIGRGEIDE